MHEKIKEIMGIKIANCSTCRFLGSEGDGPEYNGSWPVCDQLTRMSNLNTFPFQKEMKCWEPGFWQTKYPNLIKDGTDEEVYAAQKAFRDALIA